jgi:hypothetical protein
VRNLSPLYGDYPESGRGIGDPDHHHFRVAGHFDPLRCPPRGVTHRSDRGQCGGAQQPGTAKGNPARGLDQPCGHRQSGTTRAIAHRVLTGSMVFLFPEHSMGRSGNRVIGKSIPKQACLIYAVLRLKGYRNSSEVEGSFFLGEETAIHAAG